ncbi:AI-2E family transporter [Clostridium tyrobutyricum]|uniref:AI-2E family transporter n=1 Tax=Clostridium tyrobutyricum TaxID=1519 RepID=UPI001C38FB6E|nr:AI-2E family transporter [Clostridium tyrobutyricum]MBV4418681.1 AI-2E family transporter [Clostridium tyrobutyricum]
MKINGKDISKKYIIKYSLIFFILIAAAIFFIHNPILKEISYLIIISFLVAYTLKPFQKKLIDIGINKSISGLILIGGIIFVVAGSLFVIIPYFMKDNLNIRNALNSIQNLIDAIYIKLKPAKNNDTTFYIISSNLYDKLNTVIQKLSVKICDTAVNLSGSLLYLIIVPIIVYYFLADGKHIKHSLLSLFPVKSRSSIVKIGCHVDKILGRYILSQLILSLFVGIVTFIILILLKVDFPFILSLINAFFNIIPYFGPIFGAIPAIFLAFTNSPKTAVEVIICLYVLQQLEGNILCPKITGDSISMHPLTVIILLLLGGKIAGFIGMVAAVPLGAAIKVIYKDLNYYIF